MAALQTFDFDLGAYVWQGDLGSKVLVVVDDDAHGLRNFEVNRRIPEDAPIANGLYELANIAAEQEAIRAIGFFEMDAKDNQEVLKLVASWITTLKAAPRDVYFLIDVFHKKEIVGDKVMKMVFANFPGANFSFLSRAGAGISKIFSGQIAQVQAFNKHAFVDAYRGGTFPLDFSHWLGLDDDFEKLVWPEETKAWFNGTESPVPHDLEGLAAERLFAVKEQVRSYLVNLLRRPPPEAWFADAHFPSLHKDLKGLVGVTSILQGGQNRAFTLGNAALLLAGITKGYALDGGAWISRLSWVNRAEKRILPVYQDKEQARAAVAALVGIKRTGLFSGLKVNQDNGEPLVQQAIFTDNALRIILDKNLQNHTGKENERPPLLQKIANWRCCDCEDGEVYKAYRDFLVAAGKTRRGVEPVSLSRCYCQGKETILEIIPVA